MSRDSRSFLASTPSEEDRLFVDILHDAPLSGLQRRTSVVWSILYCLLLAGYALLAVVAPWIFRSIRGSISSLLCSSNVALLVITAILQQYQVYQVRRVRLQGYYMFSQKLKHIVRLPFATVSYGTAGMLLIVVWNLHLKVLPMHTILRIIMLVEVISAGSFMSVYVGCIHQYNKLDNQPDVLKPLYSELQPSNTLQELRYHEGGHLSDPQMALLQYQRENIHYLSEEILHLRECLSKYERTKGSSTCEFDFPHLLAAHEQELRVLSAETKQMQSELHLARNMIAEKDCEIKRVRALNGQYIEENERLRAILGEWSARAAKLERALEAERTAKLDLQKNVSILKQPSGESQGT